MEGECVDTNGTVVECPETAADDATNSTGDGRLRFLQTATLNSIHQISQDKTNRLMKKLCNSWTSVQNYARDKCNKPRSCNKGQNQVTISAW